MKQVNLIVAFDENNGIGIQGTIPWKIPADLKLFRDTTSSTSDPAKQNAVIMGRKTWESIPERFRPLPKRRNIILTSGGTDVLDVVCARSFVGAVAAAELDPTVERTYVIGGAEAYKSALPYATLIYVTRVMSKFDCDVFFPEIPTEFAQTRIEDDQCTPEGLYYHYELYARK
jgi:dihydrofolate reductase